jgi:hypothetical protein
MPTPSLARDFFDSIANSANKVAAIRALMNPADPTLETDWLDFKTVDADPSRREKQVRETWSKALGGFANNQGGVLLWGIFAKKAETPHGEIDAAVADKPADNPIALKSRLIELQRGATDPPLANVLVEGYEIPGRPDKGDVVCYVPEGPFKPYRSEQAGPQYYLRAGDSTKPMSRAVLAALFYPRTNAVFHIEGDLSWDFMGECPCATTDLVVMKFRAWLENTGTATAKDVLVALHFNAPQRKDVEVVMRSDWIRDQSYFRRRTALHPGLPPDTMVEWRWLGMTTVLHTDGNLVVPALAADPLFRFTVYAEDHEPQRLQITFDGDALIHSRGRPTTRVASAVEKSRTEGS